jgi:uncharacterized membrane protein YfhO
MLNVKYIVYGSDKENIIVNPFANGPAWFVKKVMKVNTTTEELQQTTLINPKEVAVMKSPQTTSDDNQWSAANDYASVDSLATIALVEHQPPYLKYESASSSNGMAVFSEIFYPKGWHAFIDGKEVSIVRANYVLRALEVPSGKHTIEFKFEPRPYTIGNHVTMASGWVLLMVVLGSLVSSFREE